MQAAELVERAALAAALSYPSNGREGRNDLRSPTRRWAGRIRRSRHRSRSRWSAPSGATVSDNVWCW